MGCVREEKQQGLQQVCEGEAGRRVCGPSGPQFAIWCVCVCVEHGELAQTSTRRAIPSQKAEVGVTQEAGNLF